MIVVDTNALISGLPWVHGAPAPAIDLLITGEIHRAVAQQPPIITLRQPHSLAF
jgi:predicted nucleic acid-binding protein